MLRLARRLRANGFVYPVEISFAIIVYSELPVRILSLDAVVNPQ